MTATVNKFLVPRDKFMPEIYLRQPGFTNSACGLFNKNINNSKIKKQEIEDISIEIS